MGTSCSIEQGRNRQCRMIGNISKYVIDIVLWSLAVPIAFWIRLESIADQLTIILLYVLIGFPLKVFVIAFFGLHRRGWRNVGVRDLAVLLQAIGSVGICLFAIFFLIQPILPVPRSIPIIECFLGIVLLGGLRLLSRLIHESMISAASSKEDVRVIIVGAGDAGILIAREMIRHPESGLRPVGFLDDDKSKQRQTFCDIPVLGTLDSIGEIAAGKTADKIIIAIPSAPGRVIRKVVESAREAGIKCETIPGMYDLLSEKVTVSKIREVDVEDLLRREPVQLELEKITKYVGDRVILVSGAGGSIGSEIVNQVARFDPRKVILLGRGENSLFEVQQKISQRWPGLAYKTVVADVRNRRRIYRIFSQHRPEVVFHAAAHKHVPLMEENSDEAILNNVGGTRNMVNAAVEHDVNYFVNISTDKAVNPTSIMGASKRAAEFMVGDASKKAKPGQIYVSVRFGNVLGSRGSVVQVFREQIKRGGPVTITHPDMMRYFMTIPEAAQLVLKAASLNMNGSVFVLDMGEPVKIIDLARDMIRYSGMEIDEEIKIDVAGIRPGEKLFEEYLTAEEGTEATLYDKIYVAKNSRAREERSKLLEELIRAAEEMDCERIKGILLELIPSYSCNENGNKIRSADEGQAP